jgi:hypothetical protein
VNLGAWRRARCRPGSILAVECSQRQLAQRLWQTVRSGAGKSELLHSRRRRFQACPQQLEAAGHKGAKELFDVEAPPEHEITSTRLMDNGEFRSVRVL